MSRHSIIIIVIIIIIIVIITFESLNPTQFNGLYNAIDVYSKNTLINRYFTHIEKDVYTVKVINR